ncbi:MAG TPA: MFS transporter [Streptosporangiales bacterium]
MSALMLTYWINNTMLRPLMGPYAASRGADAALIGVVLAAWALPACLFAIPIGLLADRRGYRVVLVGGSALLVAGTGLLALIRSPLLLLVPQTCIGVGAVAVWLSLQGLMIAARGSGEESVEARRKRITNYSALGMVGQLVGPAVGGFLTDLWGYRGAFAVAAVLALGCLAASLGLPRIPRREEGGGSGEPMSVGALAGSFRGAGQLLRGPGVLLTMGASFCTLYLLDVRNGFQPLYFHELGLSASFIGVLLSVSGLFTLVARVVVVRLMSRFASGTVIAMTIVPSAVTVCGVILFHQPVVLFVLAAFAALLLGVLQPITLALTADYTTKFQRGIGVGLRMVANRTAQWVDPTAFGALLTFGGFTVAFGVTGVLMASAGLVMGICLNAQARR